MSKKDRIYFNAAGIFHKNDNMELTRMQWVAKYFTRGSKLELQREPDNIHDANAIKIVHVLAKTGRRICIGYVPNSKKNKLANELAPLMDNGWNPSVHFSMVYVDEKTGDHKGMKLWIPSR